MDAIKTGIFISELRKEKNLTQKQLADLLFVSDKAVSRWETGKGFPELSIMEDLADALGVSVAEILKAQRFENDISCKEVIDLADESLSMYKNVFKKQRINFFLSGFLFGLIILIIAITHLNSPIIFDYHKDIIKIETINNNRIIAILDKEVAGYDIDTVADEKSVFINCYKSRWYELFGNKKEKIVSLGNSDDIDFVYYYPGQDGDTLIYSSGNNNNHGGVKSLPRLIYNYWIMIGMTLSFVFISLYLVYRKRYYSKIIFIIATFFVSFTLSLFIVLAGKMDKIYNASYYLSGILLLTICLTFLITSISMYKSKTKQS